MNSDEDPSFHFVSEGPSGVLGIFGETSVLPVMSTSTAVSDLEDVFAKATVSIPLAKTVAETSRQEKTIITKDSSDDVLSAFEVDSTLLSHANDNSKKALQVDESSALSDNAALATEIQEVLVDANQTLETENPSLVSVQESTKTIEEVSDTTVVGTVELAEEIMEAFANSKAVLDAANPVATDTASLQEELDQLDQLAVERVREIEGELVNSSKQITESNLALDISKVTESNEENIIPKVTESNEENIISKVTESNEENIISKVTESNEENILPKMTESNEENIIPKAIESNEENIIPKVTESNEENVISKVTESNEENVISKVTESNEDNVISNVTESNEENILPKMTESNEENIVTKMTESNDENNGLEKIIDKGVTSSSNLAVSHSDETTNKIADESSSDLRGNEVQTSFSAKEIYEISAASENSEEDSVIHEATCKISEVKSILKMPETKDTSSDEEKEKDEQEKSEMLEVSEKTENNILIQKELSEYIKAKELLEKELSGKDKSNHKFLELEDKEYAPSELQKSILPVETDSNTKSNPKETDQQDTKFEGMAKQVLHTKEIKQNNDSHNILENVMQEKEKIVEKEKKNEIKSIIKDNLLLSKIGEKALTEQQDEEKNKNIKNIHNYDTEDDDLEVLEAFIVRSATNPEIAICSTDTEKGEMSEKYTEESALIDDLTTADDNSMSGSEKYIETKKEATSSIEESVSVTPPKQMSVALESMSQIIVAAEVHSPENESKLIGNDALRHAGKHKLYMSNGNQLPLKKRLSQRPVVDIEQIEVHSDSSKVAVDKNVEKKIVSVEVVKQGRTGTARKSLIIKKSSTGEKYKSIVALTRIDDHNIDSASKSVSHDSDKDVNKSINDSSKRDNVADKSNTVEGSNKQNIVSKPIESPVSRKSLRKIHRKIIEDDDDMPLHEKINKREILSPNAKIKNLKRPLGKNIEEKASTSQESMVSDKIKTQRRSNDKSTLEHKNKLKKVSLSPIKVKTKKEYFTRSAPVQEKCIKDKVRISTSISKTNKKDKIKLKTISTPTVLESFLKNNLTEFNKRTTRSSKRVRNIRDSPLSRPFKKIKYKDSVQKSTLSSDTKDLERMELSLECDSSSSHNSKSEKNPNEKLQTVLLGKQKNAKRRISDDSSISSHTFKKNQVGRETKEYESSIDVEENISDILTVSERTKNLQKLKEMYSDSYAFEFENITFEMLKDNAKQLVLPSSLWGVQICHEKDIVIFSRVCTDITDNKLLTDKAIVFQGSLKPVALIMNQPVDLPILSIRTFEDVVLLIRNFHTVSICEGTGVTQRPQSKYCFRYQDIANSDRRCSQCVEERRRVLFACIRKLKEKLRSLQPEMGTTV